MNTMNIRPAFQYRLSNTVKGLGLVAFYAIMVVVIAGAIFSISHKASNGSIVLSTFSVFDLAAPFTLFVMGISTIREDIRLMVQNGIGRRTVFVTELLVALSVSLLLAVAGELLISIGQALAATWPEFSITDLYQILYANGVNLSFGIDFERIALAFSICTFANLAGMFISLLYYRLNKAWTLAVSIGVPLLLIFGLPMMLTRSGIGHLLEHLLHMVLDFILSGPWALSLCFLLATVLTCILNWLMMRRAPVLK
jgi:hypothetical protein